MLVKIRDIDKNKAEYHCACGTLKVLWKSNVNSGHTRSCGCLRKEVTAARSLKHGHKTKGKRTRAYITWVNMKARCTDTNRKDAKNYVNRGIDFDPRWEVFENFLADMGEPKYGDTIERVDNSKGYSKDNCVWASRAVQGLNKRNNVRYEFNGQKLTLPEWSKITGVGPATMLKRIQRGVPLDLALFYKGYLNLNR